MLTQTGELVYNTRAELDAATTTSPTAPVALAGAKRRLQSSTCRTNVFNSGYFYCPTNGARRIRWVVGHYWWFFTYRAYAYTGCQRRAFFGWFWFPTINVNLARAYGAVSAPQIVGCSIQNNLCRTQYIFNTLSSANYSIGFGFFRTHTVCVPTLTASGWVHGEHRSSCCDKSFISTLKF